MFRDLLDDLYAHSTMTMDDILFRAKKNDIVIDASVEDKITASKDGESITFDINAFEDGTIYIFDI